MAPPADPSRGRRQEREQRSSIDRVWLWRILLILIVVAFVVLIAKAALMAFGGAGRRLEPATGDQTRAFVAGTAWLRPTARRPGADKARGVAMLE